MSKLSMTFLVLAFLVSCTSRDGQNKDNASGKDSLIIGSQKVDSVALPNLGYFKLIGDSVIIPSFEIEVDLSQKANDKLNATKETIIVAADFTGLPKDKNAKEYLESGQFGVANSTIELSDSRIAKFKNIKFSKALYDSLEEKDISLLINIYSGRRSSKDNLLNCDILEDKMSNIKDHKFTLKGKLIGER